MAVMTRQNIIYISAEAIVGAITVVGNIIVLLAIYRTKRLHTITNLFICSLALADVAVGTIVAPCAALSFLGLPRNVYGCIFINCAILMFTNISILMLLTIAVERFLAIRFPFVYERVVNFRVAVKMNISIWILGTLLGLLPMYGWNKAPDELSFCAFTSVITMEYMVYFQFFAMVLVPLLIMFCIYLYILHIVRQHMKTTRALQNMFRSQDTNAREKRRFDKDVAAAKLFALLFFLFGLFWLPVNILNTITLFCSTCNAPYEVLLTAIVLSHANSTINPFLYAASNSRIKDAIKALFGIKHSAENLVNDSIVGNNPSMDFNGQNGHKRGSIHNAVNPTAHVKNTNDYGTMGDKDIQEERQNTHNHVVDSHVSENSNGGKCFTGGRVSFLIAPDIIENENKTSTHEENDAKAVSSHLVETFETKDIGKKQTHSMRDEIDKMDRLTPLDGIMANIYDSVDDDTKDIILNKDKEMVNETRYNSNNNVSIISDLAHRHRQEESHDLKGNHGRINHGFINDEDKHENITNHFLPEGTNGTKPNAKCNLHSIASQSTSNLSNHDPVSSPQIDNRSLHPDSGHLHIGVSQDSAVNMTTDNDLSVSSVLSDTQTFKTFPNNDNERPPTSSRSDSRGIDFTRNSLHSPSLPEGPNTTRGLINMESEADNVMGVKHFQESQTLDFCNSNNEFDNSGVLKNRMTERTHL